MAYSPLEKSYMDSVAEYLLPQANAQSDESDMQLASSNQVMSDAPGIVPIPQTGFEKVMEKTGLTLEQIGSELDKLGKVKLGGIEIGIRDLLPFVGSIEDGKLTGTPAALQAAGRGESLITGTGFTTQLKPDAKMMALDVATAGVAKPMFQAGKTAVKGAAKALPKDMPVGMSIKMLDGTEQVLDKAPKIETKAFKNWFGESKVVDEKNKPLTVYHGTKDNIDQFMQGKPNKKDAGWLGDGFYFTDNPELASTYAEYLKSGPEGANVIPVYLSIKNPYEATIKDKEYLMMADRRGDKNALKEFTDNLIKQGYDGVVLDYKKQMGVTEPVKEYVAFKPEQIKSVFNEGTFDPKNPKIVKGVGIGGTGAAATQEESK
jgi:hypothetical protein